MSIDPKIIAIDFDGTLVRHAYPDIGAELPLAFKTLKDLRDAGHKLILYTMRSDIMPNNNPAAIKLNALSEAVKFCHWRGITFDSVNKGIDQEKWTTSPKVYAHLYIDDAALGCPVLNDGCNSRSYVDWVMVRRYLISMNYLDWKLHKE